MRILRDAGQTVRDEKTKNATASHERCLLSLDTVAGAVWFGSVRTARFLLARNTVARRFLAIQGDKVILADPVEFSRLHIQVRGAAASDRLKF